MKKPVHITSGHRRDWRVAAFGGGCCSVGIACLMLVACSGNVLRPSAPESSPVFPEEPVAAVAPSAPIEHVETIASPATPESPWPRLRQRMSMPGCGYNNAVRHWSSAYTRSKGQFEASLSEAMPYILIVLDELERRDMPGEFAFLPYIESTYTPLASTGDRAAGIWQLMPDTAREVGIRITPDYDGRLDISASTLAALDLVERYAHEFGDWRLADLAYNVGEYGVKNVATYDSVQRTAAEMASLRLNPGAHQHLSKLLAVACVVSDPERFHVELPEPTSDDALALIEFPAPVDLALVARISGVDLSQMRHFNPGFLRGRMPADGPYHLLVPAAQRQRVETTLAALPRALWQDWHEVVLQQSENVNVLASANDLDPRALADVNRIERDAALTPGTHLLLPGRVGAQEITPNVAAVAPPALEFETLHIVRAGDTLWSIAQHQHVRVADIVRWNGVDRTATLHLGQRLRLNVTEGDASSSASTR